MKTKQFFFATILGLSTAVISGFANFLNKFAVASSPDPVVYTALKNGLVALALLLILLILRQWKEVRSLRKAQWLKLSGIGLVGGGLPFALFFLGLAKASALNAALIHKTLVIWVAVLAVAFLKERLSWPVGLGVLAVFLGNVAIGGFTGFKFSAAELMILSATLLWAVENVIAKIALKDISASLVACARMTFGLLVLIPLSVWRGGSWHIFAQIDPKAWGWTFIASLLLLVYVLTWYSALKRAPAIYVAALLTPATLVTNILTVVFITHSVNWQQLLSGILFIGGLVLLIFFARNLAPTLSQVGERVRTEPVRG